VRKFDIVSWYWPINSYGVTVQCEGDCRQHPPPPHQLNFITETQASEAYAVFNLCEGICSDTFLHNT